MPDVNTNHLLEPGSAQSFALQAALAEIKKLEADAEHYRRAFCMWTEAAQEIGVIFSIGANGVRAEYDPKLAKQIRECGVQECGT